MNPISALPNIISTVRLIAAPVVLVLLIRMEYRIALIIFIAAAVSDLLDGYLARRYELKTKIGAFLDPIADKLLIFLSVTYFVFQSQAPWWWLCIIILRDATLIVGLIMLKTISVQVEIFPTLIGKAATAFNMLAVVCLMAATFKPLLAGPFIKPLVIIASVVTFFSLIQYTAKWYSLYRARKE